MSTRPNFVHLVNFCESIYFLKPLSGLPPAVKCLAWFFIKAMLIIVLIVVLLDLIILTGMWVIQPKFKAYQSSQYNPTTGNFLTRLPVSLSKVAQKKPYGL